MFFRYLEHVRQKPVHVRNQYAFWFAVAVVLVIGFIWVLTLPQQFNFESRNADEGTAPFAGLMERLRPSQPVPGDDETQATTSSDTASTATTSGGASTSPTIILSEETLQAIASSARSTSSASTSTPQTPPGRMILIATTSAEAAAEPE